VKLYVMPGACSLASHIALVWSGLPFSLQMEDRTSIKSPRYLALNPSGAVPMLEHDGWVLTQCVAILNYVSDLVPEAGLGGHDARTRAEVNRWLGFMNSDLQFAVLNHLREQAQSPGSQGEAHARVRWVFQRLNEQLQGDEWLAGTSRASIADAYAYTGARWSRSVGLTAGMDALEGFYQRMQADPGVQAALKAEGIE